MQVDERLKDFNNYDVIRYERWHLGSRGQRTGAYFSGIDDFNLFMPKFDSQQEVFGSDKDFYNNKGVAGNFENLVYNMQPLQKKDFTSRYTYDSVLGNFTHYFKNTNARHDKRILLITDSQGKAVAPFFILSYQEFHAINRKFEHKQIEAYKPDVVIVLQYAQNAAQRSMKFTLP